MRVGLTTTAIFGDLSGYFFRIFRDKASSIIWWHATPPRAVTDWKMNDLEWPWAAIWRQNAFSANTLMQHRRVFWSPLAAQIWMKIDPYYQLQKCKPMNLVSENIRFVQIFAGVPFGRGVKRHWRIWGLSTMVIFVDFAGYLTYVTICYLLSTGKRLQN